MHKLQMTNIGKPAWLARLVREHSVLKKVAARHKREQCTENGLNGLIISLNVYFSAATHTRHECVKGKQPHSVEQFAQAVYISMLLRSYCFIVTQAFIHILVLGEVSKLNNRKQMLKELGIVFNAFIFFFRPEGH